MSEIVKIYPGDSPLFAAAEFMSDEQFSSLNAALEAAWGAAATAKPEYIMVRKSFYAQIRRFVWRRRPMAKARSVRGRKRALTHYMTMDK